MDFLKANTRFDEECILEWYESFHKDCPTGKITKEEFVKIYEVYFPHGNSVQFVNNFFRTTDKDNNGYIDFKEFLQTMNIINAGTTLEKLSWAFKVVMDRGYPKNRDFQYRVGPKNQHEKWFEHKLDKFFLHYCHI